MPELNFQGIKMKILPSKDEIIPMMIVAIGTAFLVQMIKAKFPSKVA